MVDVNNKPQKFFWWQISNRNRKVETIAKKLNFEQQMQPSGILIAVT